MSGHSGRGYKVFTGIITDIGNIIAVQAIAGGKTFKVATQYDPSTIAIGASIACDGVCLTVTNKQEKTEDSSAWFEVSAFSEALKLTTAGSWEAGYQLNLERSLKYGDEVGGHLILGHVDALAEIIDIKEEGKAKRFTIAAPSALRRYLSPKGSISLNGVSLTINAVDGNNFDVLLIEHSLIMTNFNAKTINDKLNIEIDNVARILAKLFDEQQLAIGER